MCRGFYVRPSSPAHKGFSRGAERTSSPTRVRAAAARVHGLQAPRTLAGQMSTRPLSLSDPAPCVRAPQRYNGAPQPRLLWMPQREAAGGGVQVLQGSTSRTQVGRKPPTVASDKENPINTVTDGRGGGQTLRKQEMQNGTRESTKAPAIMDKCGGCRFHGGLRLRGPQAPSGTTRRGSSQQGRVKAPGRRTRRLCSTNARLVGLRGKRRDVLH